MDILVSMLSVTAVRLLSPVIDSIGEIQFRIENLINVVSAVVMSDNENYAV